MKNTEQSIAAAYYMSLALNAGKCGHHDRAYYYARFAARFALMLLSEREGAK